MKTVLLFFCSFWAALIYGQNNPALSPAANTKNLNIQYEDKIAKLEKENAEMKKTLEQLQKDLSEVKKQVAGVKLESLSSINRLKSAEANIGKLTDGLAAANSNAVNKDKSLEKMIIDNQFSILHDIAKIRTSVQNLDSRFAGHYHRLNGLTVSGLRMPEYETTGKFTIGTFLPTEDMEKHKQTQPPANQ